jgi:two-component system, NarL family, nitrate/nitrite response regulator NarL
MRILLVDDHTLFREALIYVLKQWDAQVIVLEASNAEQATKLISHAQHLDLVLLDLDLPDTNGLELLPQLHRQAPTIPIVVISGSESTQHIKLALNHGAAGYIPKSCSSYEMLTALRVVMVGDIYIPPNLLCKLKSIPGHAQTDNSIKQNFNQLTARQIEVLALMAQGMPNKVIARNLALAEGTVKLHVAAILKSLSATNRTQAVTEATKQGLFTKALDAG